MDDINDVQKQYNMPAKFKKERKKQYFGYVSADFVKKTLL